MERMSISDAGTRLSNPAGRLHAVQVGHADVQNQHIGLQLLAFRNRFTTGVSLSTDLPAGMRQNEGFDPAAHQIVIVSNQNTEISHVRSCKFEGLILRDA